MAKMGERLERDLIAVLSDGSEERIGRYDESPLELRRLGDRNPEHRHEFPGRGAQEGDGAIDHSHRGGAEPHSHTWGEFESQVAAGKANIRWRRRGSDVWE